MKPKGDDIQAGCFWWPIVCAVVWIVVLTSCATQEYERQWVDANGVTQLCKAKAESWWKITEAEKLMATVSCSDDRDTTFGAEKLSSKGDVDAINAVGGIAEKVTGAAVEAAIKASPVPGT